MVELVDDHDIEVVCWQRFDFAGVDALDRAEDVIPLRGFVAVYPQLAKRSVFQHHPEGVQALLQNLFAMGDEQEVRPIESVAEVSVVECRHHCLAGSSRSDNQVSVVAKRPFELNLFE